jgi:hypothetical protein
MTAARKSQIAPGASENYKLAAALRRAKVASTATTLEREVRPTEGKIRVVLSGKVISRDHQESLFGPAAIDIPEFRQSRNKTK